jgi:hypothetical protein
MRVLSRAVEARLEEVKGETKSKEREGGGSEAATISRLMRS